MPDELSQIPKPDIPGVELIEIKEANGKKALIVKTAKENLTKHKAEIERYMNDVMPVMRGFGIQKVCFKE